MPASAVASIRSGAVSCAHPGQLFEVAPHGFGEARIGGDPRADRRGAHVDLVEPRDDFGQPVFVFFEGVGESRELLAERHGDGILKLRAPDLQDVRELATLCGERGGEQPVLVEQPLDAEHHREFDRGRVDVVRRLRTVDVVDRAEVLVGAERMAELLKPEVGDHLVGVHVGARAGAALDHADHELVVVLPRGDALARRVDHVGLRRVEHAEVFVGARRRLLHAGERDAPGRGSSRSPAARSES